MKKKYRKIEFPALTKEQEEELEALENMKETDINTEDIPEVDFSDAALRYVGTKGKPCWCIYGCCSERGTLLLTFADEKKDIYDFRPNLQYPIYQKQSNIAFFMQAKAMHSSVVCPDNSDINPELRYNAAKEDPYAMKKKVVRGGSWKDVSQFIRSDMRSFEYQNETRSYIGFRCARTQIGFSKSKGKK